MTQAVESYVIPGLGRFTVQDCPDDAGGPWKADGSLNGVKLPVLVGLDRQEVREKLFRYVARELLAKHALLAEAMNGIVESLGHLGDDYWNLSIFRRIKP